MTFLIVVGIIILVLVILALLIGLQGLIFWGIGCFVCWAFQIPYEFTFFHGLAIALIVSSLEGLFSTRKIKIED